MAGSDGKLLHGQRVDPTTGVIQPYTRRVMNYDDSGNTGVEAAARTEIAPIDSKAATVEVFDALSVSTLNADFFRGWSSSVSVKLPPVLTGITTAFNTAKGEGGYIEEGDGEAIGTSASLSLSLSGQAQASLSIIPDVQPLIRQIWTDVRAMNYTFFIASGTITDANIRSALGTLLGSTVNAWPVFKPVSIVLTLKGFKISINARATIQQSVSISDSTESQSWSEGEGTGYDVENIVRTVEIPPTIHDNITISSTSVSDNIDLEVDISWPDNTNWPARSANPVVSTSNFTAEVTPTSIGATSPSSIPSTGLYLYESSIKDFSPGVSFVHAVVIDAAQFA